MFEIMSIIVLVLEKKIPNLWLWGRELILVFLAKLILGLVYFRLMFWSLQPYGRSDGNSLKKWKERPSLLIDSLCL